MSRYVTTMTWTAFIALLSHMTPAVASGFQLSCCPQAQNTPYCKARDLRLDPIPPKGLWLQAFCQQTDRRTLRATTFDLHDYIANDDGELHWRRGGNFYETSPPCYISINYYHFVPVAVYLNCNARRINGSVNTKASIRISDCIDNRNGFLDYDCSP